MVTRNTRESGLSIAIRDTVFFRKEKEKGAKDFHLQIANTLSARMDAFRLAFDCYLEKEFVKPRSYYNDMYTIDHDQYEETITFNLYTKEKTLAGTMSLVFEDKEPVPASLLFNEELNTYRKKNIRIAEVTRLAINKNFRNSKHILLTLIDHMIAYAFYNEKADALTIEVHPHHKKFYSGFLGFQEISESKPCPFVSGSPAVCLYLPLSIYANSINSPNPKLKYYKKFMRPQKALYVSERLLDAHRPLNKIDLQLLGFGEIDYSELISLG